MLSKLYSATTPSYVIDESKLIENLKILKRVQDEAGCKILLAQKAFSSFVVYPLIGEYLAGTTASGIYEARLGKEKMGKENHVFAPAYKSADMEELVKICDKDLTSDRGVAVPDGVLTDDLSQIMDNPEISIVVELIGGIEPARSFVLRALQSGKDIVTANKALIANCGPELFDKARELGRTIAFEASVCGGIPLLSSIQTSLQANTINSIKAIVNGTCNFILSKMEEYGSAYADVLKEAQGVTEETSRSYLITHGKASSLARAVSGSVRIKGNISIAIIIQLAAIIIGILIAATLSLYAGVEVMGTLEVLIYSLFWAAAAVAQTAGFSWSLLLLSLYFLVRAW